MTTQPSEFLMPESASGQPSDSLPVETVVAHRGRPRKYATEAERRAAKNLARKNRRREQAEASPKVASSDTQNDWRARKAAREEEKRLEQEQERVLAQFRNDFGNQELGGPDVLSAADVIVEYLVKDDNYNVFKTSSMAEKRRMISEMQEEMTILGMDAATRSFDSVSAFITRLVRDCSKAHALENHTGEGLSENDMMWIQVQRIRGKLNEGESDLEGFIRPKYPLWSAMKDVLAKRPAFKPLDMFDSGDVVDNADIDSIVRKEEKEEEGESDDDDNERKPAKDEEEPAAEIVLDCKVKESAATQPPSEVKSGIKRRISETSVTEGTAPPTKNGPRPRKYSNTPRAKIKPAACAIAEILKIQRARDRQAENTRARQEAIDERWLELESSREDREARMEAMQIERMEWEQEERERRRSREAQNDERQAKLDLWEEEDREARKKLALARESREAREEERREERFQQEMDERRIRMWMSLRAEEGPDVAGRMVWGDAWERERSRFPVGLTTDDRTASDIHLDQVTSNL